MNWRGEIGWFCCKFDKLPADFFTLTRLQWHAIAEAKAKEASESNGQVA